MNSCIIAVTVLGEFVYYVCHGSVKLQRTVTQPRKEPQLQCALKNQLQLHCNCN